MQRGHLVYDPFVGTGSILVAAAYYDAYTLGADIDIRVIRDGQSLAAMNMFDLVDGILTCLLELLASAMSQA